MTHARLYGISMTIAILAAFGLSEVRADNVAPQPQETLQQMLGITWTRGPNLPQGFQDSDAGIIDNTLITATGFCTGQYDVPGKPSTYPRGFLQKTWGLPEPESQNEGR